MPNPDPPESVLAEMRSRIMKHTGPGAEQLVAAYYDPSGPFAADSFDTVGDNNMCNLGGDDLAATALLDVSIPPLLVRATLRQQPRISALLHAIDPATPIWDADDDLLAAVQHVWEWLQEFDQVGPVIASKVLARKRPNLSPIYDDVVERLLQPPEGGFWVTLRSALQDEEIRDRINALTPKGLSTAPTTLRLLDVAVWMAGSESRNARNVRATLASR